MHKTQITFDTLPEAVSKLLDKVSEIQDQLQQQTHQPEKLTPVGIEEACRILGKAKPTVYALVRKRLLPCYKSGKKLYFFEKELLEWIINGKKKTISEIQENADKDDKTHPVTAMQKVFWNSKIRK